MEGHGHRLNALDLLVAFAAGVAAGLLFAALIRRQTGPAAPREVTE